MPKKAKSALQSIFQVIGGTYAPAPVNFSAYSQAYQQSQNSNNVHEHPQHYSAHNHNPAMAGFVPPPPPLIDPFTSFLTVINSNPYVLGVLYLFLNLSGRFLSMELTKQQEQFLAHPYLRPFILFAVLMVGTRNIAIAFWSTIGILAIIWIFANENHVLCLIPGWRNVNNKETDKSYEDNMKALQKKGEHHEEPPHPPHDDSSHGSSHDDSSHDNQDVNPAAQ